MKSERKIIFTSFKDVMAFDGPQFQVISIDPLRLPPGVESKLFEPLIPQLDSFLKWNQAKADFPEEDALGHKSMERAKADAEYSLDYRRNIRDRLDPLSVVDEIFRMADGQIPVIVSRESNEEFSHRRLVWDWLDKTDKPINCKVEEWSAKDDEDESKINEMLKKSAISTLEEFNRYRRGEGEYMWNEDPTKNKPLTLSPRLIGEAIDFAVQYMKEH